jgi:hypothetical protein
MRAVSQDNLTEKRTRLVIELPPREYMCNPRVASAKGVTRRLARIAQAWLAWLGVPNLGCFRGGAECHFALSGVAGP